VQTLRESTHSGGKSNHQVVMDLSHLDQKHIDLLFSWIEIWLRRNCKSGWHIVTSEDPIHVQAPHHYLKVEFEDAREALYFKLSPEFVSNNQPRDHRFREWMESQAFLVESFQITT
jgi:hypothetical protein